MIIDANFIFPFQFCHITIKQSQLHSSSPIWQILCCSVPFQMVFIEIMQFMANSIKISVLVMDSTTIYSLPMLKLYQLSYFFILVNPFLVVVVVLLYFTCSYGDCAVRGQGRGSPITGNGSKLGGDRAGSVGIVILWIYLLVLMMGYSLYI